MSQISPIHKNILPPNLRSLLVLGLFAASTHSCNPFPETPSATPESRQTPTSTVTPIPSPTTTSSPAPTITQAPTSTPATSLYSNSSLGLSLSYPSNWSVSEAENIVAFTSPDGWAQISMGWFPLTDAQSTAQLANSLVGIHMEEVSDPVVVPIEHEGGDPVEILVSGFDSAGVRWVYHFIVADSGEHAFIVETVATTENLDTLQPIFEAILTSLETPLD